MMYARLIGNYEVPRVPAQVPHHDPGPVGSQRPQRAQRPQVHRPTHAQGKSQSRLNSLQERNRSALRRDAVLAFLEAPPCSVEDVALAILTPAQTSHPLFADIVEIARWAEGWRLIPPKLSPVAATRKKIPPDFLRAKPEYY
jgi:hypothetical protein